MGIIITRREVDVEIEQLAQGFGLPVQQWMKLLSQERGIKPEQYANDIIWPSLALRKLAGKRLDVTQKELTEAFEMEYGPAVKVRLIVCTTAEKARKLQALAAANPAEFGNLAKDYSEDGPSASVKGLVPPIRKHSPCPEIEVAAFGLADGQVSGVIRSCRTIRDPEARGPDCRPTDHHGRGRAAIGENHSRPQDAASGHRDLPGTAKEIPRAKCLLTIRSSAGRWARAWSRW